jgi:hypothetical protein
VVVQRIERRIGRRQHFQIKTLVKSARQELRRAKFFRDRVEVQIGGRFRQSLIQPEKFLEGEVQPNARRCSAEQIVMASKDVPDSARILQFRLANLEILKRDSLAVERAIDVVVGLHEELCRIRERLVPGKPRRLRMPVRTNDRQRSDLFIECLGGLSVLASAGNRRS